MNRFDTAKPSIAIIHHRGAPLTATTLKGQQVTRQEALFVPEWSALVKCAPYDDHFVYENPDRGEGTSAYMCTCGSAAVVVPPGPRGMFVCLYHATFGRHTTSDVNLKDFEKSAGQTIQVKGSKRWV